MFSYPAARAWGHRKGIITYTQLLLTQQTPSNTFRFVIQFCTHPVFEAWANSSFVYLRLSRSRPVGWILRSGLSVPNRWKTRITKGLILCRFLPFFDPISFVFNGSICFQRFLTIAHLSQFTLFFLQLWIYNSQSQGMNSYLQIYNLFSSELPRNNKLKKVIVTFITVESL